MQQNKPFVDIGEIGLAIYQKDPSQKAFLQELLSSGRVYGDTKTKIQIALGFDLDSLQGRS